MASHRINSNYISEADRLKKQVYLITAETMGLGNFVGALLFALFIVFDKKEISLYDYPIPFVMLFLSLFSLWLKKSQMEKKLQNYLYTINYISIPLIVFYFVDDAAVTIWSIVFLYLIPAFVLQNGVLISYAFAASLATLVGVMIFSSPLEFVQVGIDDHLMRIAFFIIAAVFVWIGLNSNKKKEEMLFHYMDQAEEMAFQDPLLKIPNRIDFNLYVDHALQTGPLVLWKVEIHHFQSVYDVLGHQKSDELLALVKQRLAEQLDNSSYLAKGEGSTFLVAATSWLDKNKTDCYFDGILRNLAEPYELEYHDYLLSFNIGAACSLQDGSTSDELMRHAQFAVDKAKELGLNRAVFCSNDIKQNTMKQVNVSEALFQANLENEFYLVYQPQIDMETNQMVGLEALLRWEHPQMGAISPNTFVEIAEKNGFIVPLGKWVLEKACREVHQLSKTIDRPLKLAVNVSFIQICQPDFVEEILAILKETGFSAKHLEIELTERSLFENRIEDLMKIEALRSHGIRIAIDDFGTGYSSFGILAKIKVDKIKVPREFIDHVDSNPNSQRIVETIASMAERFNITCLAEGIERQEENEFLLQLVCQEAQGYFYAKPAPIKEIEQWLKNSWLAGLGYIPEKVH